MAKTKGTVDRTKAITYHDLGWTQKSIAAKLNIAQSTVSDWIKRYKADPNNNIPMPKPRVGRPKKVTAANIDTIRRSLAVNPTQSVRMIRLANNSLQHLALRTINEVILKVLKLPSRMRAKKPRLTDRMRDDRYEF